MSDFGQPSSVKLKNRPVFDIARTGTQKPAFRPRNDASPSRQLFERVHSQTEKTPENEQTAGPTLFRKAKCCSRFEILRISHTAQQAFGIGNANAEFAIVGFFRSFLTRCPTSPEIVLTGWMDAISGLGLEDMSVQVKALFQDGRIPPAYCNFEHFLEDLRETLDPSSAVSRRRYEKGLITDAIDELSKWHCYADAFFSEQRRQKVSNQFRVAPWTQSLMPPKPKIGRNEPCPCGSGKKYRKCCLH